MDEFVGPHRKTKRRRRYSPEYKARILAECADPNVSVAEVARRHGINDNMVHNWRSASKARGDDSFIQLPALIAPPLPVSVDSTTLNSVVTIELPSPKGPVIVRWPLSDIDRSLPWLRALLK